MAKSKIEWTEYSWNPISGCTPISEGCQNCYAKRMSKRLAGRCGYPEDEPFKVTLHNDKLNEPLTWKKPRRVFVCSMSDLFHEDVPEVEILKVFAVMADTPQHTYMILTKRPERMKEVLTSSTITNDIWLMTSRGVNAEPSPWPLPNAWLGVTAENQQRADERIPILLQIPAAVRFVSVEPMLGPVDFTNYLPYTYEMPDEWGNPTGDYYTQPGVDWVICGGETGPGARPVHPEWVQSLRDQCQAAGAPFFFKSWGEWGRYGDPGVSMNKVPFGMWEDREFHIGAMCGSRHGEHMAKVGKKAAGRLLDGRTWDEMPEI